MFPSLLLPPVDVCRSQRMYSEPSFRGRRENTMGSEGFRREAWIFDLSAF